MEQSNFDIGETIKDVLGSHKPSTSFEETWSKQQGKEKRILRLRKRFALPLIALITFMALFTVGFASYQIARRIDNIDYPFVDDASVIGKWKTVDFVKNIADFNIDKRYWNEELFLSELAFIKEGKMLNSFENGNLAYAPTTWTKGKIINEQEKTASGYDIRDINGKTYLFMQWKSGDYIFKEREPYYYVLEKVDSQDYSDYSVKAIMEDKIDYSFELDTQMLGRWESVDFVKDISQFSPNQKSWLDDLYLTQIDIFENSKIEIATTKGSYYVKSIFWTKGLIIDTRYKTASKCTIKEIDGDTYMFYEWKSGDYTYRGMKPYYYVLKKDK